MGVLFSFAGSVLIHRVIVVLAWVVRQAWKKVVGYPYHQTAQKASFLLLLEMREPGLQRPGFRL